MAQTEVMSLRISSDLKHDGDDILSQLGISPSSFVNMAYSQLVMHQGVPFELKVTSDARKSFDDMPIDKRRSEIKLGHDDYVAERVRSADDIHAEARAKYGF